jgi:hypothetical protein
MQPALFQQATITQIKTQVTQELPGHGPGLETEAVNDDLYQDENSPLRLVLSVMANVIGGTLLLSGMFFLPQLIAEILS